MSSETILTLNLKPHLEDFVRHELKTDKSGNIVLSRHSDIGKMIFSHLLTAGSIQARPLMDHPVKFLVLTNANNSYLLRSRFCYVDRWGEQKINDFIEVEFRQRMRLIFEAGYQKKCSQKEIIEAIMEEYNIKNCTLNYDAVKKSDYRNQKKIRKSLFDTLQSIVL